MIEFGVLGVLAWRLAGHYDRHHEAHKFDTGLHLMSRATAIDKYLETYGTAKRSWTRIESDRRIVEDPGETEPRDEAVKRLG